MAIVVPEYYNRLFSNSYPPICAHSFSDTEDLDSRTRKQWISISSLSLTNRCAGPKEWPYPLVERARPKEQFWPALDTAASNLNSPLCRCPYETGEVFCFKDLPEYGLTEFVEYCKTHCLCIPPLWQSEGEDQPRRDQDGGGRGGSNEGNEEDQSQSREPQIEGQATSSPQCQQKGCFSWSSCFTGGNTRQACGNMICWAVQQAPGLFSATGKCVLPKRHRRPPLLGGRDVNDGESLEACPCNSSYVSYGCCNAEEGLVWEDPSHKLGVLLMDADGGEAVGALR